MKLDTPEIAWHNKEPIYSCDFKVKDNYMSYLATGGADSIVRIWELRKDENDNIKIEVLSNLQRHTKSVNVVRFSPIDNFLATAGDDNFIIIWIYHGITEKNSFENTETSDEFHNKELWVVHKFFRGHIQDVYDICWSNDNTKLIVGTIDNKCIIWDFKKGNVIKVLEEAKHYVQGVSWDPLDQYIITMSTDRCCRVYSSKDYKFLSNINKHSFDDNAKNNLQESNKLFHDETLMSFFRRPSFSPDGSIFIVPSGVLYCNGSFKNNTFIFARNILTKPIISISGSRTPSVAVKFCPSYFELRRDESNNIVPPYIPLEYRFIFCVVHLDSVYIYDTQQFAPISMIADIHYASLTDASWSVDGSILVVTSSDGFCSIISFESGELGSIISDIKNVNHSSQLIDEKTTINNNIQEFKTLRV